MFKKDMALGVELKMDIWNLFKMQDGMCSMWFHIYADEEEWGRVRENSLLTESGKWGRNCSCKECNHFLPLWWVKAIAERMDENIKQEVGCEAVIRNSAKSMTMKI